MRARHAHPHGLVLGFHLAELDEADKVARADRARIHPKPHLDQADDDYEFVNENLTRWADRKFRGH